MIKVFVRHEFESMGTGIIIADIDESTGRIKVAKPVELVFEDRVEGSTVQETLFFYGNKGEQFLQGLSNALIETGFKPDEIRAYNKEVEAIKYHLEDLRRLVFKKLTKT